ncbi:juvenile hormone esterase-like [Anticarsia gemmatalis]|uniref:juvenile hormone esterase-like n=1 Tax=Anticarsia gemmatalis TaxID=129554 RepID=UPI003F75F39D
MGVISVKWLVLVSLWAARLVRQPTAPVRVSGGLVRGAMRPDGAYAQYFGIPYATVTHRFQDPKPDPQWDGVFDAVQENIRCTQRFTNTKILGTEDCLTLNVYTPREPPDRLLPVMVFIHGGGYRDGSGSPFIYAPKHLLQHGVLLVTFNYRLEILGFLCLGIKEAPGNAGLKDQVEALKWVQRNIKAFGGDPDNVTIFGESAGAASVVYHLVSPMSNGLFKNAIMQSGSAMSPWSLQFQPLETASKLAYHMGYNTKDPYELYKIFNNVSAENLLRYRVPRKKGDIVLSENIFVPCVEKEIPGVNSFLTDTPYNLIVKGEYQKVPVIYGFNNAEGLMFTGKENATTIRDMDFYHALPRDLKFPTDEEKRATAKTLDKMYMNGEKITNKTILKFAKFEGDSSITYPTIATIDLFLKSSDKPVFVYKFCYDGMLNYAKMFFGFRKTPGATHADEIFYLFSAAVPMRFYVEQKFIDNMTELWTNFAKYGDPTPATRSPVLPKWNRADPINPQLLVIDQEFSTEPVWQDDVIKFWNTTYSKYRRKN